MSRASHDGETRGSAVHRVFDLGVTPTTPPDDAQRVRLVNGLTWFAVVFTFAGHFATGDPLAPRFLLHTGVTLLCLTGVLLLHRFGRAHGAALLFHWTILASIFVGSYTIGFDFGSFYFLIILSALPFLVFPSDSRRSALLAGLASTGLLVVILYGWQLDGDIARRVAAYGPFQLVQQGILAGVALLIGYGLRSLNALASRELEVELAKSDEVMQSIFPTAIGQRLRAGETRTAERSGDASVIFCEIVGLRSGTGGDPDRFLRRLHAGFSMIDELCVAHGIQKIKTSGSIFIAAAGLSAHREDHAEAAVGLALALQDELAPKLGVALAIGVNSGPVVSGVIGVNRPTFDIWGDTVNTAQRVSSHGPIGEVSVSALTFAKINHRFSCEAQEPIELKGKGSMRTYVVRALRGGSP